MLRLLFEIDYSELYVTEVGKCCAPRRLQLNAVKTEVVWFCSKVHPASLEACSSPVDSQVARPVPIVRDPGLILDAKFDHAATR